MPKINWVYTKVLNRRFTIHNYLLFSLSHLIFNRIFFFSKRVFWNITSSIDRYKQPVCFSHFIYNSSNELSMPTIRRSVKAYPFLKYCNCMYLLLIDRCQVIMKWYNQWNASLQSISAVHLISFIFHLCSTDHPEPSRPVSLKVQVNKLPVQCTNKPCMSCKHAHARSPHPITTFQPPSTNWGTVVKVL